MIRLLGSLTFAVVLIVALLVVLIVATFLESSYGTPFAQKFFYQTGWFDGFLALVALNLVCSVATRFPFKKIHLGFITTHAGIILVLVGSFLSRAWGVDGQMMLYEGETQKKILENQKALVFHTSSGTHREWALKPSLKNRTLSVHDGLKIKIQNIFENAHSQDLVEEGAPDAPQNHAVLLSLSSDTVGLKETQWLIEHHPSGQNASHVHIGPAEIELLERSPQAEQKKDCCDKGPELKLSQKSSGHVSKFLIDAKSFENQTLGKTGFKIEKLKFYPDARVDGRRLISVSDKPNNPAVEFDLVDDTGVRTLVTQFALFPGFEALHGKRSPKLDDWSIEFHAPESKSDPSLRSPALSIYPEGDRWFYRAISKQGEKKGELKAGESYKTGWMDFKFTAEKLIGRAKVERRVSNAATGVAGQSAVQILPVEKDKAGEAVWIFENEVKILPLEKGPLHIQIDRKSRELPFSLTLKDFRKVDYPGSTQAESYESDAALRDEKENLTIEKTIKMNKPLDYKGYRVFQSSYVQEPGAEASVFTIAKNPGIGLIYSGSIILFIGVGLVFFVKPFSSLKR